MTPQEQAAVEALLLVEHEQALASEESLVAEYEGIIDASAGGNLDDEHDPEGATVGYDRARVASLLRQVRDRVSALAAAHDRVRAGVYGTCSQCGQPISSDRLMAFPTAEMCVSCAKGSTRQRCLGSQTDSQRRTG